MCRLQVRYEAETCIEIWGCKYKISQLLEIILKKILKDYQFVVSAILVQCTSIVSASMFLI